MHMTQFGPPPLPTSYAQSPPQRYAPAPWSASAIAGFVMSLLGVTAILGLIFGIVGIFASRGGRRRGMGLAIAAIPISCVTGAVTLLIGFGVVMALRMANVPQKVQSVFVSGDVTAQAARLRTFANDDWNQKVSDERLIAWLTAVRAKHGTMTGYTLDMTGAMNNAGDGAPRLAFKGKFVNGDATVQFTFDIMDPLNPTLKDVEVDGSSALEFATNDQAAKSP